MGVIARAAPPICGYIIIRLRGLIILTLTLVSQSFFIVCVQTHCVLYSRAYNY